MEKLRFSRMVDTSWTETSASALDDDAAGGVEVAGALSNKGKLHKPTEVRTVSNPSPTITLSIITNSLIVTNTSQGKQSTVSNHNSNHLVHLLQLVAAGRSGT